MRYLKVDFYRFCAALVMPLLLAGCANNYASLDSKEHTQIIKADYQKIEELSSIDGVVIISLSEAIDQAIYYNLDARVSALEVLSAQDDITLEELKALPNLSASASYQGRNNLGASSSRSVISGNQSLEPSISTEPHRRTADLTFNWNLIDVALAALQSENASDRAIIAQERHKKVKQNIQRDVYTSYWRAYAAQENKDSASKVIAEAEEKLYAIDLAVKENLLSATQGAERKREIENRLNSLRQTMENMAFADIELKSLLSLSPDTKVHLTSQPKEYMQKAKTLLDMDVENLELLALEKRPEMRETIAQRKITLRDTRMEIIKTFPGMKLFYAGNYDSNDFLVDNRWTSFSATIVQSITSLITAPARYEAAKTREDLEEARRLSLAAAIITQIHLSRARLSYLLDSYALQENSVASTQTLVEATKLKQKEGFASDLDVTLAQLESLNAKISASLISAETQSAAAAFLDSLGENTMEGLS